MATSVKISAGRGRGRAKNLLGLMNNPGENGQLMKKYSPINNPKPPENVDPFKPVEEAMDLCLRETTPENLQFCLSRTDEFATSDEKIKKVVSLLFDKCLEERRLASSGGQVAAMLTSSEKIGHTFRNMFLKKFQDTYKNRGEQRKNDYEKYLCFSIFLCSIFKDLRVNGEIMKVLTKPVYGMLDELLDEKMDMLQREKATEVLRDNLLMVALLLQETDSEQMDLLFKKLRINLIKEKSPKISCTLLETFEYYSSGEWTAKDETRDFYNGLMDDVTAKS